MARMCLIAGVLWAVAVPATAQDIERGFGGALIGVSTLSADGRSVTSSTDASLSLYKPENGLAVDVFGGWHLANYFSVQANYMWNRNDLTLVSSFVTPSGGGFYDQQRTSEQHVFVADTLVYFRRLDSRIRPYLGTGLAIIRFASRDIERTVTNNLPAPQADIAATKVGLRSHVGIDFRLSRRVSFRYSFSETISGNPISPALTPEGERRLANFQNLFGFVMHF
jgi:hypothetical protein